MRRLQRTARTRSLCRPAPAPTVPCICVRPCVTQPPPHPIASRSRSRAIVRSATAAASGWTWRCCTRTRVHRGWTCWTGFCSSRPGCAFLPFLLAGSDTCLRSSLGDGGGARASVLYACFRNAGKCEREAGTGGAPRQQGAPHLLAFSPSLLPRAQDRPSAAMAMEHSFVRAYARAYERPPPPPPFTFEYDGKARRAAVTGLEASPRCFAPGALWLGAICCCARHPSCRLRLCLATQPRLDSPPKGKAGLWLTCLALRVPRPAFAADGGHLRSPQAGLQ